MAQSLKKAARRKPKKVRRSGNIPLPPEKGGAGEWFSPLLGGLALFAAWLAFLGAVSNGHLNWNALLETDTLQPYRLFQGLKEGLPLSGWLTPGAWMWFPDYAILWPLFALGAGPSAGALLFPLLLAVFSSVGWILVCDFVFGRSPTRRAVVLVLHALPLLVVAWRGLDVFFHQMVPVYRGGLWATMPWTLWLSLRALEAEGRWRVFRLAALAAAAALLVACDLIAIVWVAAPAAASAVALAVVGKLSWRGALWFVVALAAAVLAGRFLNASGENLTGRNFALAAEVWRVMRLLLAKLAARNPLETIVWAAFAALAAVRVFTAIFPGEKRRGQPGFWRTEQSRRHLFAVFFVAAGMLLPVLATLSQTAFGERLDPGKFHTSSYRYFLPLFYFALFSGWALLPWQNFGGIFRRAPRRALAVAAAAVVALAAPRAAAIRAEGLDMFASPFHQCFAENARRLGWSGGIANWWAMPSLAANPSAGVERTIWARGVRGEKESGLTVFRLEHSSRLSGEYQFVGVNVFKGRVFLTTPAGGEPGCPLERIDECVWRGHYDDVLDESVVRAEFGPPAEIVECEGYGFYHYDPPLRLDFSKYEWIETYGIRLSDALTGDSSGKGGASGAAEKQAE